MGAKCRHAERLCFSTVITRIQRPCSASILPPYAAPLLGRSLSGSQQSRERASSLPPFPLLGTASPWSNLAAIPPCLVSLRLNGSVSQSLPGSQDTAVPAVGADIVRHPGFVPGDKPLPQNRAASQRLRGFARISVVAWYSYSKVSACSRRPLYPARTSVRRSLLWAVPAQAAEAVFPPFAPVSSAAPGSLKSPFRGAPEPAAPTHKTASAATLHFVPRPMALPDS